jgi:dephospho-CoA kinase
LTGDLGSGKSTVAAMLAERGAVVFSSDEMGRQMMQPGHLVFDQIVRSFGKKVLATDGTLDRAALAKLAFAGETPRVEELNALVHPAVIAEQQRLLAALAKSQPHAIAVVESALIFTTTFAGGEGWQERFDTVVCVTAPESVKVARFVERVRQPGWSAEQVAAAEVDAKYRLEQQRAAKKFEKNCLVVANDGSREDLELRVGVVWGALTRLEAAMVGLK